MSKTHLSRNLGLIGLAATGICSMLGASINVVPFMIQRNVEGIGPYVIPAFIFAAFPALFAAFSYSILGSAMPRAGGSYIYASRGLHPYLGFVASFSQWFGLSIVIGVVSYVTIPFFRDFAGAFGWEETAQWLDKGSVRVTFSLIILWLFIWVNIMGVTFYERILIPLMVLMFILGSIVIIAGFMYDHQDFAAAILEKEGRTITAPEEAPFDMMIFFKAAALLFASFIGFDSIAQAGGEAKNPTRNIPRAIGIAIISVGLFYMLFTAAVYHAVPWNFIASEAMEKDITAPGILSYLLPSGWGGLILLGAAIALINDLPAMLLSVSRLVFSWAEDGIFPKGISKIYPSRKTPYRAILLSGTMSTIGIFGSHFAGDFFLGIDIMVTSMLVNFLLMCITVLTFPRVNPELFKNITILKSRTRQLIIGWSGVVLISFFLVFHTVKDLSSEVEAWYFHSTPVWIIVMLIATFIYGFEWKKLKRNHPDPGEIFNHLPTE